MSLTQPKPFLTKLRHRNHAIGVERRRNLSKMILENGSPLPLPVEYVDIDSAFFEWVDKKLDLEYDGKKLPTYKLFSNQKLSEYSQTWSNLDENNNIIMNFKTITRESNPQHGESQGGNYNVPGNRNYPMFYVPVLQENGEEAYDLYTMKQPLSVNFLFTVSIICNKYELLNEMNSLMQREFNSLECYIFPNKHPMPMVIESISDETQYSIDDRKYYAQSFQIKLMGYIIRKDSFKITKIPSRFKVSLLVNEKKKKRTRRYDSVIDTMSDKMAYMPIIDDYKDYLDDRLPKYTTIDVDVECGTKIPEIHPELPIPPIGDEDYDERDNCPVEENDPFFKKRYTLHIYLPICESRNFEFISDIQIEVDGIETFNIHDFNIYINNIYVNLEEEVNIKVGDVVRIEYTREDEYKDSKMIITGVDNDMIFDSRIEYESVLDEPIVEEEIHINKKDETE